MNRHELMEYLIEQMGARALLQELTDAMSEHEAQNNFEHICSMWDIPYPNDDDNEESEENV